MMEDSQRRLILLWLLMPFIILSVLHATTTTKITHEDLEDIMVELERFQVDMTRKFMKTHSRKTRAASGFVTDLNVTQHSVDIVAESVGPFSTFTFESIPYIIKRDGIYMLVSLMDGLLPGIEEIKKSSPSGMMKVINFSLRKTEIVLDGFEWQHNFFLLTTTGDFSTIYTMHDQTMKPVFRQRIQNKANATFAKFFQYRKNLYMICANDNNAHSTTFSPIFRWAGSYMDEIHQVQTTGASAIETFEINAKQYIAIAQSRDANGNTLLGTIVLSMDHLERLERVQLLWSNGANSLHYMHTAKEHFLVVGQEKEPAIAYWFGGMDFINWQQFDGIQGSNLVLSGTQMTADDPVLIASDGGAVKFYTRSASAAKRMTTWVQSKSVDSISAHPSLMPSATQVTAKIEFFTVGSGTEMEEVYLVITKGFPGTNLEVKKFHPVKFEKLQLTVSRTKESGDKLSQCLQSLSMALDDAEPVLRRISEEGPKVLRTDKDVVFNGQITSQAVVKMDPEKSKVMSAQITPEFTDPHGRAGAEMEKFSSPSQLLSKIEESNDKLEQMKSKLDKAFYTKLGKENVVTGDFSFESPITIRNVVASPATNLEALAINDIFWERLDNFALKTNAEEPQIVIGSWTVESLEADQTLIVREDSVLFPHNFMLKTCPNTQTVAGHQEFSKSVSFTELDIQETTEINGIPFSQVALKENRGQEISGYKHAPVVEGNFRTENVNDKHLPTWFSSVAMLNSEEKQEFTGPVIFSDQAALRVEEMEVGEVNDRNWNDFKGNVLLNGEDQEIAGLMNFTALRVDNLEANSLSNVKSDSLLTSDSIQNIMSEVTAERVQIDGSLSTGQINGINLANAVKKTEKEAIIKGPVVFEDFKVQEITVAPGVTIAEKEVSKLADLKKVHLYSTVDGSPFRLNTVQAETLTTPVINGHQLDDLQDKYWSKSRENVVTSPQLLLNDRTVTVLSDMFETHRLSEFSFPHEFVSLDQAVISVETPLKFEKPVTMIQDVTMADGATVQGIDMSQVHTMMVDSNFRGVIHGEKTFSRQVTAEHGASFGSLNQVDLARDVVFLNDPGVQMIQGSLTFLGGVVAEQVQVRDGDMDVDGMVNDFKLDEVGRTTVYKDMESVVESDILFEKNVDAERFTTELLNEMNVNEVMNNMVFLNSQEKQIIQGGIMLENGNVDFRGDSVAETINGVPFFDYMSKVVRVDSSSMEFIEGVKTFNNVVLQDRVMCSTFSDVDLNELKENALSKTKSQTITGKWSMGDASFKENLVTDSIGGIATNNIVFTTEPFRIDSPVAFTSSGGTVVQGPVKVEGNVNGITFDDNLKNVLNINDVQMIDHVSIIGHLEWENSHPEFERLGYLFDKGVRKFGPQKITGSAHFNDGLRSFALFSNKWLGDLNFEELKNDALTKDARNWVLAGHNKFLQPLRIENLVNPVNMLDVNDVNGQNLVAMNEDIVKINDLPTSDRMIHGTKTLKGKISADNLEIQDQFSNIPVSDFVVKDDSRTINEIHFKDIIVEDKVSWDSAEGIDLRSLLNERVSLTNPEQTMTGKFAFENIQVKSQCVVPMINDIRSENVLRRDVDILSPISGKKILMKDLKIEGDMDTDTLNEMSIQEMVDSTLRVDRREVITRPVIFEKPVTVNRDIDIESVNDVHLDQFSSEVSQRAAQLKQDAQSPGVLDSELQVQTSKLQNVALDSPSWLEYLRPMKVLWDLGAKSKVGSVLRRQSSNEVFISFTESIVNEGTESEIPKGCSCNKVETLIFRESELSNQETKSNQRIIGEDKCLQIFHERTPNGKLYTVLSDALSTNASCVAKEEETTKILTEQRRIGEIKMGQVSDVAVFSDKGKDFLVIAQYFDRNTRSHSTTAKVIAMASNGLLEHVQEIPTHGARKISMSLVNDRWMLAIANSQTPANDKASCNAESAIYEWSSETNQFLLLRTVMTDGVFDVEFINSETSTEFYRQSFVAFAQHGNSASGEVLIFKYDPMEGNFMMSQTLRSKWPVTSLRSTCLCRQCFLMTAVPQEGIVFYENRFVEGFQEYHKAKVFGATDIMHFTAKNQHLFVITTTKGPLLAEGIMAGSCPAN